MIGNVKVDVLDHGYVALVDHMGTNLTPVNAARASFKKRSSEMTPADERLLHFLKDNGHMSPFRHVMLQYEICAPLMVARQLWRYTVGAAQQDTLGAWNEASYRYISLDFEWYVPKPTEWRGAPDNKKQGSKGLVDEFPTGKLATHRLEKALDSSLLNYEWAIDQGIAPEQARLFLLANGLYTTWYLTISLQGLLHLLEERGDPHAMFETRLYAGAFYHLAKQHFCDVLDNVLLAEPDRDELIKLRWMLEGYQKDSSL